MLVYLEINHFHFSKKPFLKVGNFNLSQKSLKNICKEICNLESFSISMKKIFEVTSEGNLFFSVYHTLGYICDCSQCTNCKMFDISFSKPDCRNYMITQLVYSEDRIIYFLYIFILIYLHTCIHTYRIKRPALIT